MERLLEVISVISKWLRSPYLTLSSTYHEGTIKEHYFDVLNKLEKNKKEQGKFSNKEINDLEVEYEKLKQKYKT